MCFICSYYSETKNKVGKERRQAYPFSSRMICSVVHGAKRGREKKKKKTARNGIASQPLPTIYPSLLALNSWSELWVTLPATCPALRVRERETLFRQRTVVVAVLTSRRQHPFKSSVPVHLKCD